MKYDRRVSTNHIFIGLWLLRLLGQTPYYDTLNVERKEELAIPRNGLLVDNNVNKYICYTNNLIIT
jgi:hypothetical protein